MTMAGQTAEDERFQAAVAGLRRGDFSTSAPLFARAVPSEPCRVLQWVKDGRFREVPDALDEAFTCACFLGETRVASELLAEGLDSQGGAATGLNALHWAVNRGQLETVRMLLGKRPLLEVRNMYGGTVLGAAIWAAIYEPRPEHLAIIEALLKAGAIPAAVEYPTGVEPIDGLLERYGAKSDDGAPARLR
jgi:ankyrin repeat protein